jgi:hypothetical protein
MKRRSNMSKNHDKNPRSRGLTVVEGAGSRVRDDREEYRVSPSDFVAFADLVEDKLPKARAVAWLMQGAASQVPPETIQHAAAIVVELIDEVLEAQNTQWETFQRHRDEKQKH